MAEQSAPINFLGKTVDVEEFGRGVIIDQTETCVGILIDGRWYHVLYVPISALKPWNDEED